MTQKEFQYKAALRILLKLVYTQKGSELSDDAVDIFTKRVMGGNNPYWDIDPMNCMRAVVRIDPLKDEECE